ncbi:MAG: F0F1 ATP synthase subunit B [Bacteroidales bacterium]|nr:F0F1 ATP synthase subunit B [Bacteroidales bacterium]
MSLFTPDAGLLFWMVIIFGLLFFILAKWGFPLITSMVDKRSAAIDKSLRDAKEVEVRLSEMTAEHERMLSEARKEQSVMLKEASDTRKAIIEEAKTEARAEADKILSEARVRIEAEKESALRDIRREVAMLSVGVAEKILRKDLSDAERGEDYLSTLVEEAARSEKTLS